MAKNPKVMVLSGYGLNCEDETKHAFELAGFSGDIVHINDLIQSPAHLKKYLILAVPGGFSFGDDLGSGRALAAKLTNHLGDELRAYVESDRLVLGICNGFQVLVGTGLLPGALLFNKAPRYNARWVDLKVSGESPWLSGIKSFSLPIAHGEGRYFLPKRQLSSLKKNNALELKYVKGEICRFQNLPANPNGSVEAIAAVSSHKGRVLGLMPHPERAVAFTQLPHWTYLREEYAREGRPMPKAGPGLQIFKNAYEYFK